MEAPKRNDHVLLHVRAYGDCPVSLAMTHMRWLHGQCGHLSTEYTLAWSSASVGCESGPSIRDRNKDAGTSERKTPRPLVKVHSLHIIGERDRRVVTACIAVSQEVPNTCVPSLFSVGRLQLR